MYGDSVILSFIIAGMGWAFGSPVCAACLGRVRVAASSNTVDGLHYVLHFRFALGRPRLAHVAS